MHALKVIAITHKETDLDSIGHYYVSDERVPDFLPAFQERIGAQEMCYLATCNRVEFIFTDDEEKHYVDEELRSFFQAFFGDDEAKVEQGMREAKVFEGEEAIRHLFMVASSLESMVIGEREIITQVRKAFERCREAGMTGDILRLVIDGTVKTAKEIYTRTRIATQPVSVVSLAYQKLLDLGMEADGEVLVVGAGKTNRSFCRFLKKHGFNNFRVLNRSIENAQELADELEGEAGGLEELQNLDHSPSVLLTSTASREPIVPRSLYEDWQAKGLDPCVIVDLALPSDLDEEAIPLHRGPYIGLKELRDKAQKNMKEREREIEACHRIIEERIETFHRVYKEREVELAMRQVPQKVKEIRKSTLDSVFADEIEKMDPNDREVLDKVVQHLEKKYMSVPMKMAREILLEESGAKSSDKQ
jgi:glutamyl-tRNA reductase